MEATVSTVEDVATLSITTEDFVIGTTETDDGYWTYSLNGGETVSVYTSDDLVLTDLPNGDHTILISLVDSTGTALDPVVEQTIEFSTFNGLAECDETVVYTQVADGDYTVATTALAGQYARVTINATMEANYDSIIVTDGAGNQLNTQIDGEFVDDVYTSIDGTITVQVLNDGSVQNGDVTLAFTCIDPPTMEASVVVDGANATFTIATENFTIGQDADADGHWHYSLNGGDAVMVYTTDETLTDLPNGDHTILIWLVDSEHNPLDPAVEQTIEFSTFNGIPECGDTVTYAQVANGDYSISVTTDDDTLMASVTINATMEVNYYYIIVTAGAGNQLNTQIEGDL